MTLGPDLGVADAPRDDVYEAMDWLLEQQDGIEAQLAGWHLREGGIAMFDLSSSWVEGKCCELAARGYSRDGKKGREQIEYWLLTDPEGRPVAIRVFAGNTADPSAFIQAVDGHGRRPRDDHLSPDQGAERTGRLVVDHLLARPGDP